MNIENYKNHLLKNGIDMSSKGFNSYVLDFKNALIAIDILEKLNIIILGGDVFLKKRCEIDITTDSWGTNDIENDDSYKAAREYINIFQNKKDSVYFDIVINYKLGMFQKN